MLLITDTYGNITGSYVQEGFGNVLAYSGLTTTNWRLTTKEIDPITGLYYFYARWYDPEIGRFITQDHFKTCNLYSYVKNNPINLTDPTGLAPCTPTALYNYVYHLPESKYNDKYKHCYLSCHANRCGLDLIPNAVFIGGVLYEWGDWSGWDIVADAKGIACSYKVWSSCEKCCDVCTKNMNISY